MDTRAALHNLVRLWLTENSDRRDSYPFDLVLDEILFHADLRLADYAPYDSTEGDFPERLLKWVQNGRTKNEQQSIFKVLDRLNFICKSQMRSLTRDAYRRIIAPRLTQRYLHAKAMLDADYDAQLHRIMQRQMLLSITESFSFPAFTSINSLRLQKPTILGEDKDRVTARLPDPSDSTGVIVFEDFVGTGKQAVRILREVRKHMPDRDILFAPLIALETGLPNLAALSEEDIVTIPALVISSSSCISKDPLAGELEHWKELRALINHTSSRVLARLDDMDDPPSSAFGYRDSGAFLVTCHNAPNNTIPLIHHRAPTWNPLFRRLHHPKT